MEKEVFFDEKIKSTRKKLNLIKDKAVVEYLNDKIYTLTFAKCLKVVKDKSTFPKEGVEYKVKDGASLYDIGMFFENANERIYKCKHTLIRFSYSGTASVALISLIMESNNTIIEINSIDFKNYFIENENT